jgi:hypothetical protein
VFTTFQECADVYLSAAILAIGNKLFIPAAKRSGVVSSFENIVWHIFQTPGLLVDGWKVSRGLWRQRSFDTVL